ncbi:RNA annealing protein [Scheffersomyces stipitis CBS 6054]|uniref:RNA annealing protein n=1 Tax=Scheffersomyces stipitis (strain ATCC 58785 / CBS 6054 / NBRC 10063 / NRRL Y-11545) TaxID=322104 RepID=A3GHI5_PICST|nr:RNA annealing protein [Scheffersomyces stipitis CBS 6054]EAZ63059.1 RNA annealing protein [Scheffersomyces stipitis CBS 6054]
MSSLDKSLDDIISSTKRPARKFARSTKTNKVGKKVGAASKKTIVSFKKAAPAAAAAKVSVDLSYATKVVVSGLPKDLKQDNIKDFFQSQVGGVLTVALTYNEKGQFRGIATVIFRNSKNAALAVEKYNGAPIDGGSSKLKLELIVDPSKKPLASRIAANKVETGKATKTKAAGKAAASGKKAPTKAKQQPKKKPAKKTKKSVEELDQEMADYMDQTAA